MTNEQIQYKLRVSEPLRHFQVYLQVQEDEVMVSKYVRDIRQYYTIHKHYLGSVSQGIYHFHCNNSSVAKVLIS